MESTNREGEDPSSTLIAQNSNIKCSKSLNKLGIKMLSYNCRSIRNKVSEVVSKLDELDIDICMLQETWLTKGDDSVIAEIKDYGFEINSRRRTSRSIGGGVAVLYKPYIDIRVNKNKTFTSFEHMIATVNSKNKLYRIINIYRPDYSQKHRVTPITFFVEFSKLLDEIIHLPGVLIITGDFNFHIESPEDSHALQFTNMLEEYSLHQLVMEPTHENGGLIDLVITSDKTSILDVRIHGDCVGSDHFPILFDTNCHLQRNLNSTKEIWIRDHKKLNVEEFKNDIMRLTNLTTPTGNVDNAVDYYGRSLINIMNNHCPLEFKRFKKRPNSVWYTHELLDLKRKRRMLERKLMKENTQENKENYRKIKNSYNWKLKDVRNSYFRRCLNENKEDPKSLNSIINKLTGKKCYSYFTETRQ
jgi:exonuclease III